MSALDEVLINARSDWGYNSFELAKIIMAEQEVYNMRARIAELENRNNELCNALETRIDPLEKRIAELENPWQPIGENTPPIGKILLGKYIDGHWNAAQFDHPSKNYYGCTHYMLRPKPPEEK